MSTPRVICDQCALARINGAVCHEQGCVNMGKVWEQGAWVRYRECGECGGDVREGEQCDCNEDSTADVQAYPPHGLMVAGYDYAGPITFDAQSGWLTGGQFPADCIQACSASGSVDDAVEYWTLRLGLASTLEEIRPLVERYLKEFGAWGDLAEAPIATLAERVLWHACCEIRVQGEWLGLVH